MDRRDVKLGCFLHTKFWISFPFLVVSCLCKSLNYHGSLYEFIFPGGVHSWCICMHSLPEMLSCPYWKFHSLCTNINWTNYVSKSFMKKMGCTENRDSSYNHHYFIILTKEFEETGQLCPIMNCAKAEKAGTQYSH